MSADLVLQLMDQKTEGSPRIETSEETRTSTAEVFAPVPNCQATSSEVKAHKTSRNNSNIGSAMPPPSEDASPRPRESCEAVKFSTQYRGAQNP